MSESKAAPTSSAIPGLGRHALTFGAFALLFILALWPFWTVEIPPLVDYPNHLARMHILSAIDRDPALQNNYAVDWELVPNLVMDAIVPVLVALFGLFTAGKIFVLLSVVLPVIGVAVLHRTLHGAWSLWPAAALLFVYGQNLIWGFLNYVFAVGLFFLIFAAWIATERWPRASRLALFSCLSTVLYFSHFFAFCVYGLSILGYELWRTLEAHKASPFRSLAPVFWRWTWAMGQFVIPGILLLMAPEWDGEKVTAFGEISRKVVALLSPVLTYGDNELGPILILIITVIVVFWRGWVRVAPAARLPLALLGIAAILMPHCLASNWFTDYRLPTVIAMFVVAATQLRSPSRWVTCGLAVLAVLLFVTRTLPIAEHWRGFDRDYAQFRQAAQSIDEGARVLSVVFDYDGIEDPALRPKMPQIYLHLVSLAVIDRAVFTPLLFTNRAAQPVMASPATAHLDVPYGRPMWPRHLRIGADPSRESELLAALRQDQTRSCGEVRPYWLDWPREYDYVLFVHWGLGENPMPELLVPHEKGSYFDIYKITKDSAEGPETPASKEAGLVKVSRSGGGERRGIVQCG